MPEERAWTNSWFGRSLGSAFGVFIVGVTFTESPANGPRPWHGSEILTDLVMCFVAVALVTAVWTTRLELKDGTLTATNFFRSQSMPLADVVRVSWSTLSIFGGKFRREDGSGIRTLVSGRTWDELWTPRATKIEREVLDLAEQARGAQPGLEVASPSHLRQISPGPENGSRFALVRLRASYDISEVDAFVGRVNEHAVTSTAAEHVQFKPVRLRQGYDIDEVDDYIDGLVLQLKASGR